jgi:hypothetical protein
MKFRRSAAGKKPLQDPTPVETARTVTRMAGVLNHALRSDAFLSPPVRSLRIHGHFPPPSRSTPHAPRRPPPGPAGAGRAQIPPAGYFPTDRQIAKGRTGLHLDEQPLYLSMSPNQRFLGANQSVPPHSASLTCWRFSLGQGRSRPVASGVPAGWLSTAMPALSMLFLISRNPPKQLDMVSPELRNNHSGTGIKSTLWFVEVHR